MMVLDLDVKMLMDSDVMPGIAAGCSRGFPTIAGRLRRYLMSGASTPHWSHPSSAPVRIHPHGNMALIAAKGGGLCFMHLA